MTQLSLRPATLQDAELLLSWRNDPSARKASRNQDQIPYSQHREWLESFLANPENALDIAEAGTTPIGYIRAQRLNDVMELSWTVSPTVRGMGYGKTMVAEFASKIAGPIKACVIPSNIASIKIAEHVGMSLSQTNADLLTFTRPAQETT